VELRGRRVVVTGGAGFIGSHVVDTLVSKGCEVLVVDDLSVGTRENLRDAFDGGAELVVGDVRDPEAMARALDGAELVIHMACDNLRASLKDPVRTHDVNATGTLVTSLAAVDCGVERFVYVSSSEAYGSGRTEVMSEDHPLEPTTVYGASKAAGELYSAALTRTYGLPVTIVRPFNSYGPREHVVGTSGEVIPKFATRMLTGLAPVIFGDGSQTRDFTWVEETARGIVAAAECDDLVGEAVNIARGEAVSVADVARLLGKIVGRPDLVPDFQRPRPGDVFQHHADTSKARAVLGFVAETSIEQGLTRFVAWLREHELVEVAGRAAVRNW
jgi:UDP-glucose 4-epimerase